MGRRWSYLPLVAVLGAAAAVLPGVATSESLPVEAVDEGAYYHHWSNATQTVLAGDSVKFANPYSTVPHGLKFTSGPATPTCSGIPTAPSGGTSWHGECNFSTPGTYAFICTVHPTEMTGTITVNANGTTTVTTTPTPTPTTTAPSEPTPPPSPLTGKPSLRSTQRGGVVKGTLAVSKAGAGDELEVDVFAANASLTKGAHSGRTRVGRFVRGSVRAGTTSFVIRLDAKALRALKRHRRLSLTVKITLTPVYGESLTITRLVLERG